MIRLTIAQYHSAIKAQRAPSKLDITVICPMCGTHQTPRDLIAAGAGSTFEEVERFIGFSCVGRWLDAPAPRKQPDGKPCNWTLGGLFTLHKVEVLVEDGTVHPRFEIAAISKAAVA